jgi:anaerobic magnesium-protoporphyrin IX monomethyl ester cyclase
MSKIALINPPSPFLTNERVFPNIGLVRVATELDANGHDVDLHDFAGRDPEGIKQIGDYDYYGFSSTSPQVPQAMNLLRKLKEAHPDARTIIGGPHASALYHLRQKGVEDVNIKDLEVFDTIFAGEGESIENMFKAGWQKAGLIKDIDSLRIPDRSFIDNESYKYEMLGKPTTSIQTQRGCPFVCNFCSGREIEMYSKVRTHSPERVVKELDELHDKYGYSSFMWYDDEVNVNPRRLKELCEALSDRPYQHRGFVRSDLITNNPESVNWLRQAGFARLCTGVESGSDRILKTINKGVTVAQNYQARKLIGDAGMHYEAFLIIGHPGETQEDVAQTIEWIEKAKPDDFDIGILTPYPGSKIYDEAIPSSKFPGYSHEHGGLYFRKPRYSEEDTYYKGPNGQSSTSSRTDEMTEAHIHSERNKIQAMR